MTTPNPMAKFWPLGAFLAAIGYCVWPYVMPEPAPMSPPTQLPKIDASWLKPTFEPPVDRNPFLPPGADPTPTAIAAAEADAPGATGGEGGTGGARSASTSPASRPAPGPPPEPTPAFSLGATMVSGPRRAAIIDGRVYRQGERLEADGGRTWTVDWVEPGRVLLGRPGRKDPLVLELRPDGALLADSRDGDPRGSAGGGLGLGMGLDLDGARKMLAVAGIRSPMPGLLEQLASRSGGSVPGAYRSLLNLLISPPRPGAAPIPEPEGESDR